jgi:dihydroorotase
MPNTLPAIDNADVVTYIKNKSKGISGSDVFVVGAVTKGLMGQELSDIEGTAKAGIFAISDDGKTVQNSALMREAMIAAKKLDIPFFSHAEDENLGALSLSEQLIVARDILLCANTGCSVHFCHVSTAGSVELIKKAKAEGLPVTAEAAPHHFALDESCINDDGNKKMNPPLRSKRDVEAIKAGLAAGTIDAIATDHAPHARAEKNCPYENAQNGVIGLETSFAISYTELVKSGILTPMQLAEKMGRKPAEILGIARGAIAAGSPADILIVDIETEYIINETVFSSKSVNSPFIGRKVFGKPYHIENWRNL